MERRELLESAVKAETPVGFDYVKRDEEVASRVVSPYEVRVCDNGATVLVGFDHGRAAIRQFDLDGIVGFLRVDSDLGAVTFREPV